jgi:hypothetical protein
MIILHAETTGRAFESATKILNFDSRRKNESPLFRIGIPKRPALELDRVSPSLSRRSAMAECCLGLRIACLGWSVGSYSKNGLARDVGAFRGGFLCKEGRSARFWDPKSGEVDPAEGCLHLWLSVVSDTALRRALIERRNHHDEA